MPMTRLVLVRFSGVLILLAVISCAPLTDHRPGHSSRSVVPVPFEPQEENLCGPAALAMVARFYGEEVTAKEIARDIYLPEISGTLTSALTDYARRYQLWTRQYRGSVDDLSEKLAAGVPLIVLGRFGGQYHYFVVLGDGDPIVVHTDRRPFHELRREDFLRYWDRADHWTLLVCPPHVTPWNLSAAEHNDRGLFLEKTLGNPSAAEIAYRAAIEREPDRGYYYFNLGNTLLHQQRLSEAAAVFQQVLIIEPANADAMNNLAWTYQALAQHLDEAVALCQRAVAGNPVRRAYYLDTLGTVYLKQGNIEAARGALQQAFAATTDRQAELRQAIQQRLVNLPAQTQNDLRN